MHQLHIACSLASSGSSAHAGPYEARRPSPDAAAGGLTTVLSLVWLSAWTWESVLVRYAPL